MEDQLVLYLVEAPGTSKARTPSYLGLGRNHATDLASLGENENYARLPSCDKKITSCLSHVVVVNVEKHHSTFTHDVKGPQLSFDRCPLGGQW